MSSSLIFGFAGSFLLWRLNNIFEAYATASREGEPHHHRRGDDLMME